MDKNNEGAKEQVIAKAREYLSGEKLSLFESVVELTIGSEAYNNLFFYLSLSVASVHPDLGYWEVMKKSIEFITSFEGATMMRTISEAADESNQN